MKRAYLLGFLLFGCFSGSARDGDVGGDEPTPPLVLVGGAGSGEFETDAGSAVDSQAPVDNEIDAAEPRSDGPPDAAAPDAAASDAATPPDAAPTDAATPLDAGPTLGGQCAPCVSNDDCLDTHRCNEVDPGESYCSWHAPNPTAGYCPQYPGGEYLTWANWVCQPKSTCESWCSTTGLCDVP